MDTRRPMDRIIFHDSPDFDDDEPQVLAFAAGEVVLLDEIVRAMKAILARPRLTVRERVGIERMIMGLIQLPCAVPWIDVEVSLVRGRMHTVAITEDTFAITVGDPTGAVDGEEWCDVLLEVGTGFRDYYSGTGLVHLGDWMHTLRQAASDPAWTVVVEDASAPPEPAPEIDGDPWEAAEERLRIVHQSCIIY